MYTFKTDKISSYCRKLASLMFILMILNMILTACDNKGKNGNSSRNNDSKGNGVLILATNAFFEPYEYYENNNIIGIDIDIANIIANKLNMELRVNDMDFDAIIPAIQSGKTTIAMAGLTISVDREKNVSFSHSYASARQVIIVKDDGNINSLEDLNNLNSKKIGVQQGTTGDDYCTHDYGDDVMVRYGNGSEAIMALLYNKVDCVVIDEDVAKNYVNSNKSLKILSTEYVREEYAIAVAKNNGELLEKINIILDELKADGTLQKIVDGYMWEK